jgi:hypothetical protein
MRPRDFALVLLASGDVAPPRQRARDQQADRAGLDLKRRVLIALADLDPEPQDLEAALLEIVEQLGPPLGPTRSIAAGLFDEYAAIAAAPGCVEYLLSKGLESTE